MTQNERLDYLVEAFKTDSVRYKDLTAPSDTAGKRQLLRSLMNIRMPKELPKQVLKVQDEYLAERAEEKGVVQLSDIPVINNSLSIWQGDITRLAVDAIVNAANSQSTAQGRVQPENGPDEDQIRKGLRTADSCTYADSCLQSSCEKGGSHCRTDRAGWADA